ncbi:ATP-binding protein, partial [Nocardia iowensis]
LDDGTGMSKDIILNHWMTIGTNNKENNYFSDNGRIRTGAKGIGRFALDRLGSSCQMWTLEQNSEKGHHWNVMWEDFESTNAIIDDVYANMNEFNRDDFYSLIKSNIFNRIDFTKYDENQLEGFDINKFREKGTFFKITGVRDVWNNRNIDRLYRSLDSLIPPKEERIFDIFIFTLKSAKTYGAVRSAGCDDYDYKLTAYVTKEQEVHFEINREEIDLEKLDYDIFNESLREPPYDKETFLTKKYKTKHSLTYMLPGVSEDIRKKLTDFSLTIYFLKRDYSVSDSKTFKYKHFVPASRKEWLDRYGGIKIFRDHFRVRPYGDINSTSFDWLRLGERVQKSPAGIGKKNGAWRVRANQISGTINISRKNNVFEDKSSREGLQETIIFEHFQELIQKIIEVFEKDRIKVMRAIKDHHDKKNHKENIKDKGKNLAKEVLKSWDVTQEIKAPKNTEEARKRIEKLQQEKLLLAQSHKIIEESIEEKENENKLLRALAGTGIALTSLAHEIKTVSNPLVTRNDFLKSLIGTLDVNLDRKKEVIKFIDLMSEKDRVLKGWLDVALNVVSKDKRRRNKIRLNDILEKVLKTWEPPLLEKKISVEIVNPKDIIIEWRAYIIDVESILNNLIINSMIAFQKKEHKGVRNINFILNYLDNEESFEFTYQDSGPGLSKEINDKNDIFEPLFTTNSDGGTGLGLWIVKTIVEEYKGEVKVLDSENGFQLYFKFPLRKRGEGILFNV